MQDLPQLLGHAPGRPIRSTSFTISAAGATHTLDGLVPLWVTLLRKTALFRRWLHGCNLRSCFALLGAFSTTASVTGWCWRQYREHTVRAYPAGCPAWLGGHSDPFSQQQPPLLVHLGLLGTPLPSEPTQTPVGCNDAMSREPPRGLWIDVIEGVPSHQLSHCLCSPW
jgi:hypothetical protein